MSEFDDLIKEFKSQYCTDSDSKLCVFLSTFKDASDDIDDFRRFVEVEVDRVLFQIRTSESKEKRVKYVLVYEEDSIRDSEENPVEDLVVHEDSICNSEENPDGIARSDIDEPINLKTQCLEEVITGWSESVTHNVVDKDVIYYDKVEEQEVTADSDNSETQKRSYGAMRKERSWKRTLECKLLQERYNVDAGGEVMDLLWETYERMSELNREKNEKTGKKSGIEYNHGEEEQSNCIQAAFKFSSSGKSSIVRFSKVLKRLGWLQYVTNISTKHAKKGVKLN